MSAATVRKVRKINVLVVGKTPHLSSLFRSLETLGWFVAQSGQELGEVLEQTKTRHRTEPQCAPASL